MTLSECTDQMGFKVSLPSPPQRIISLVPSQTELLASLEMDNEVVGITRFCIHPQHWRQKKVIVGGTKHFDFDAIDRLSPDLIIGNKEENYLEGIEQLRKKYPVWMSDISSLPGALDMIRSVGRLVGRELQGDELAKDIENRVQNLSPSRKGSALYFIWKEPWMVAGTETFIDDMLTRAGFENIIQRSRYPELTEDEILHLSPDFVFLSSEPFPFQDKHVKEVQTKFPKSKVMLVDGEMFSWYGSRLQLSCDYFSNLPIR